MGYQDKGVLEVYGDRESGRFVESGWLGRVAGLIYSTSLQILNLRLQQANWNDVVPVLRHGIPSF